MLITAIKVRRMDNKGTKMVGVATITLDNMIAVHDIKILDNGETIFLAMPNRVTKANTFKDIVHPINSEGRLVLERLIVGAYRKACQAQRSIMALSLHEKCAGKSFSDLRVEDYREEYVTGEIVIQQPTKDAVHTGGVSQYQRKKQSDRKIDEDFLKWLEG